jgi:hypothetical protein
MAASFVVYSFPFPGAALKGMVKFKISKQKARKFMLINLSPGWRSIALLMRIVVICDVINSCS